MGVGQFFNPQEGKKNLSPISLLLSMYSPKDILLEEDHPLAFNFSFSISLGLLPSAISLETTGCGIKKSAFSVDEPEDPEISRLCKLRCFPPVALAWDAMSNIHMFPKVYSEMILVDSSPALWTSSQGSENTNVLLLVDPHCSYKASISVPVTTAAGRFFLLYFLQIISLCIAIVFFALMRQAQAWELDLPIPSLLSAVESNMGMPFPFLFLALLPILFALFLSCLSPESFLPGASFAAVSVVCYLLANGAMVMLIIVTQLAFHVAATISIFIRNRCKAREGSLFFHLLHWILRLVSKLMSFKIVRILRTNPFLLTMPVLVFLVCLVHPALGLFVLLLLHAMCCHNALTSFLMASFPVRAQNEYLKSENDGGLLLYISRCDDKINKRFSSDGHTLRMPDSARSYSDTQLEIFHHRHGLFVLHLLAVVSFIPSLIAWRQTIGIRRSFPWLMDSILCLGVMLHGVCDSRPEFNFILLPLPSTPHWEIKLSSTYLIAGYFCYLSGLALAPYRAFYAMATIGVISFAYRIILLRCGVKGETFYSTRKHSHRH